jgi:hypothetical protein
VLTRHSEGLHDAVCARQLRGGLRGAARADLQLAVHGICRRDLYDQLSGRLRDDVRDEPPVVRLYDGLQLALLVEL